MIKRTKLNRLNFYFRTLKSVASRPNRAVCGFVCVCVVLINCRHLKKIGFSGKSEISASLEESGDSEIPRPHWWCVANNGLWFSNVLELELEPKPSLRPTPASSAPVPYLPNSEGMWISSPNLSFLKEMPRDTISVPLMHSVTWPKTLPGMYQQPNRRKFQEMSQC